MEACLCRGRFIVNLKYNWLVSDVIRWRCGQLLSRDFTFLLDNIFIQFGTKLYSQVVEIFYGH